MDLTNSHPALYLRRLANLSFVFLVGIRGGVTWCFLDV
jgi:hypothetical protein